MKIRRKKERDMHSKNERLEGLTVLLDRNEIRRLKYLAIDQGVSASELARSAVDDFLKTRSANIHR